MFRSEIPSLTPHSNLYFIIENDKSLNVLNKQTKTKTLETRCPSFPFTGAKMKEKTKKNKQPLPITKSMNKTR